MKKLMAIVALGVVGGAVLLGYSYRKKAVIDFVDEQYDQGAKNFGAFPGKLPEDVLDDLFI